MQKEKYTVTLDGDPEVSQMISGFTQLKSIAFGSGEDLLKQVSAYEPLAVFVDVHLGGVGLGLGYIPIIRAHWPLSAIIVITSDHEPELVGQALAAGANDFLRKPFAKAELVARLKARVCEMSLRSIGEFVELGSGRLNLRKRYLEGPSGTIYLSPLQAELMQVLVESEGMLVPKETIKKAIWGKIAVSDNALDRRLSEMRKILKESGVNMQIISEYGKGISLEYRGPLAGRLISA